MSYIFEIDEQTVWSPALDVGRLYLVQAACIESIVGLPNGLSPMASDYYIIDQDAFAGFVTEVMGGSTTGHPMIVELTAGFVSASLVMLERSGRALNANLDRYQDLARALAFMRKGMPA